MMTEESTIKIKVTGDVPEDGGEGKVLTRKGGKTVWADPPAGGGTGEKGGYYKPTVSADGDLSWTPSDSSMPPVEPSNIKGPQGNPGVPGSDASVTAENVSKALGYTPADAAKVKQLSEEIEELKGEQEVGYETTTYTEYKEMAINTSGATADITASTGDRSWHHLVVWCPAGTVAYVTGEGGISYRAWALVAEDGSVVSAASESAICENVRLDISNDCYLVVNAAYGREYSLTVTSPKKGRSAVESRLITNRFIAADDWAVGRIKTNGGIGTIMDYTVDETFKNYRWQVIDCYDGMRINIKGRGGDASRLWCIVDKNNEIISVADAYTTDATLTVETNGKCIVNTEVVATIPMGVEYTPCSLAPVLDVACDNRDQIKTIQAAMSNRVPFGIGIDCKYTAPDIDALNIPASGERLDYFYGLYDSLLADYPEYISKVDCDAAAVAAGITRPAQMTDCPIYLYKFIPAYTSKTNAMDGVTAQRSKIKVFITTGTHPEFMAIWDMYHTMRLVCENWKTDENLEALRWDCEIYVMPCSGAYSVESGERVNYNGVDLNRNAPSSNWTLTENDGRTYSGPSAGSEYETKVFVHFMGLLAPDVYIDHHNTDPSGDPGIAIYGTAQHQKEVDILSEHISVMSRRWKQRFATVFPQDDTTIVGYADYWSATGSREVYGAENVSRSFTYESQTALLWDNGEIVSGAHRHDVVACTCATDGFLNFLLRMLKTT